MMKTSAKNNPKRAAGFTLFELLVTLAVTSLAMGLVAFGVTQRTPQLAVDRAAATLVNDLKRARLVAETEGAGVEIISAPDGYAIPTLNVDRRGAGGVHYEWGGGSEKTTIIGAGLSQKQLMIRINKGQASSSVVVSAVTARIDHVR